VLDKRVTLYADFSGHPVSARVKMSKEEVSYQKKKNKVPRRTRNRYLCRRDAPMARKYCGPE
jgi:hypothetical protein